MATSHAKALVVMNEGDRDPHCYCVHSVIGDVAGLNSFARLFGPMRLDGIQVPKRDMTLHLGFSVEGIARQHVALLDTFQPDAPIHLIGRSAGAIVAPRWRSNSAREAATSRWLWRSTAHLATPAAG